MHKLLQKKILRDTLQEEENRILRQQYYELRKQKDSLDVDIQQEKRELELTEKSLKDQQDNLLQLSEALEKKQAQAEEKAERAYQEKVRLLDLEYQKQEKEYIRRYDQAIAKMNKILLVEQAKIEDLQNRQKAHLAAQQREQEKKENEDYYRLALSEYDMNDIHLLREMQIRFARKDVIDKMIWEIYYKPSFDALAGKLFHFADKTCGIYKITSITTQQAYVGQSTDVKERFRQHIKSGLSHAVTQNRLYQELYKQGPENFTFEILEQVTRDKLNEREVYWIEFYDTKNRGLNSTRGGA